MPSSTWASCPRSRRVQPLSTRVRSIFITSTDQDKDCLNKTVPGRSDHGCAAHGSRRQTPWKARCYAFRAIHPAGFVAFGGPLLGDPHRRHRTTGPPACAGRRAGSPAPPRPCRRVRNMRRPSRFASRARMRARAAGCPLPGARQAGASSRPSPSTPLPARPPRSQRESRLSTSYLSMRPSRAGTSQGLLVTTWDG